MTAHERLRDVAAAYDDEALAALSNRGLLRRAKKDVQRAAPEIRESDDGRALAIVVDDATVRIDDRGPSFATCTCPAAGICRHVIGAVLALRTGAARDGEETAGEPSAGAGRDALEAALLAMEPAALAAWCGGKTFATALAYVRETPDLDVSIGGTANVTIGFVRAGKTLHYLGGDLDAFTESVRGRDAKRWVASAVLAFRRAREFPLPEPPALANERGLPTDVRRRRESALANARRLCEDCVALGLAHVTNAHVQRFVAGAISANGAEYYRLALAMRRHAARARAIVDRAGDADEDALFAELATTYALVAALEGALAANVAAPSSFAGSARSAFAAADTLELVGVGAQPWRTRSGFTGLTLVFWAPSMRRWLTWTNARATYLAPLDPLAAYRAPGPWGTASPAALCGTTATLVRPRLSDAGRLSSGVDTRATVRPERPGAIRFAPYDFDDWQTLRTHADGAVASGLREAPANDRYAIVRAVRFERARFDEIAQRLVLPLVDRFGATIDAVVPHGPLAERTIVRLEELDPAHGALALFGTVDLATGTLAFAPMSILGDDGGSLAVEPLAFASANAAPVGPLASDAAPFAPDDGDDDADLYGDETERDDDAVRAMPAPVARLIRSLDRAATRGSPAHAVPSDDVRDALASCERGGFAIFRTVARDGGAAALLRLRYVASLAR